MVSSLALGASVCGMILACFRNLVCRLKVPPVNVMRYRGTVQIRVPSINSMTVRAGRVPIVCVLSGLSKLSTIIVH